MKKIILLLIIALSFTPRSNGQLRMLDSAIKAFKAGRSTTRAVMLSDSDVKRLSRLFRESLDSASLLPPDSTASIRLARMTEKITSIDGTTLNFGVHNTPQVNAFAFGDGGVRVTTGLLDVMEDAEVMAIIGHELGHIVGKDTKETMKSALYTAALKETASMVSETAATLIQSDVIKVADAFTSAQFSQKQELAADDYAFQFCIDQKIDVYAMHRALTKLVDISKDATQKDIIDKMFASHPDSEKRAARMKERADEYTSR